MTHVASLVVPQSQGRAIAAAVAADPILEGLASDLSEVADGRWEVVVYLPATPDDRTLEALTRLAAFSISELPDTDWVARSLAGLKPVRAGRFLVHGRHDRNAVRANDIAIEIEAGQAFGTGHHGTTRGCLLAIEVVARSKPVATALDVGTGSGVLAIAIARRTRAQVLASDVDPVAIAVAHGNVWLNRAHRFVRTLTASGVNGRAFDAFGPVDLIVANILAETLTALAPALRRRLAPRGTIVLSGLLPGQRARVVAAYRGLGLRLVDARIVEGWLTLVMERRRPVERAKASH